jgi:hypothetical protein
MFRSSRYKSGTITPTDKQDTIEDEQCISGSLRV